MVSGIFVGHRSLGCGDLAVRGPTDTDLYKLTMAQGYLELFPDVPCTFEFTNRRLADKFPQALVDELKEQVAAWEDFRLSQQEEEFLRSYRFFKPAFVEWYKNFRPNRDEVEISLVDGALKIKIHGTLPRATYYEVPLMATISQLYFKHVDTDWNYDGQVERAVQKALLLEESDCIFSDFGTRRRRSFNSQEIVVREMSRCRAAKSGHFVGTSNVYLAMKYGTKAIGTVAHEWFMAHSALCGLRHANRYGMDGWMKVYNGDLGTALTDTYGSSAFFKDFDRIHARQWDGLRQDSGNPLTYVDNALEVYPKLGVETASKHIVFSNALDFKTPQSDPRVIRKHCGDRIKARFGIGTYFTNDYAKASSPMEPSKALNMVIKLRTCDGIEVVKLSDDGDKATGDRDAVRVAKYVHRGIPLDG